MKLKYYNLVIIVPVFFALGILLASFNYYILSKEIKNGLNEEINSISLAMQVFLKEDYVINDNEKLEKSFSRIIRFGRVNRIYLIKNDEIIISKSSSGLDDSMSTFKYKNAKLLEIVEEGDKGSFDTLIDIKDSEYKLFITVDATEEKNNLEKVLYQVIFIILAMVLIGIIVSLILSYITKKNINSLSLIAKSIANGDYKNHNKDYTIKEISDLSNTLDIVKSILKEILYKTKNSILDTDFNDKSDDFIKSTIVLNESTKLKTHNVEIAIAVNKNINQKEFFSCWNDENYIYAFVGELHSTNDYFKDYITISSVTKMIKHLMSTNNLNISKIKEMYDIRAMVNIKIDLNDYKLYLDKVIGENISSETFVIQKNELNKFNCNPTIDAKLEKYLKMYSYQEIDLIASDFNKIFNKESAIIFVKRSDNDLEIK